MPNSIAAWEQQQWGVFVAVIAAGLLAALLAPVVVRVRRDWPITHGAGVHRPNTPKPPYRAPGWLVHLYPADVLPVLPGAGDMPQTAEMIDDIEAHLAAGPGSLTSLREVGPGAIAVVEPLVDDDVRAAVGDALDAALEAFRVGTEPAMRTARRWMLQGGETYAAQALRRWHIEEITGEWPMVRPVAAS